VGLGCVALAAAAVCSSAQSAFADTPGETVAYPIGAAQGA
jgi:hypothetical protein